MNPRKKKLTASLGGVAFMLAAIVAWFGFAPTQLGGQTSYVIVNGNSMEPKFHKGDMAIIRRDSSYEVGEIVTYRHPDIGFVIHRIIGREGDRYIFKGDHNDFTDGYRPVKGELAGQLWLHIPKLGGWLGPLRQPVPLALLTVLAIVGVGGGISGTNKKQVGRRADGPRPARGAPPPAPGGSLMTTLTRNWQDSVTVLAAAFLAAAMLAAFAFTRPTTRSVPDEVVYRQEGVFNYSAASSAEAVYDTGAVTTGDPIFRRLTDSVSFDFRYRLSSTALLQVSGTRRLVAELSDTNGWRRTIELSPEAPFSGDSFSVSGTLLLADVQGLISTLERETGIPGMSYNLTVTPMVSVTGVLGGQPLKADFEPGLSFRVDPLQLQLSGTGSAEGDPTVPTRDGRLAREVQEPNVLALLMVDLRVALARRIAVLGLGLCAVVGGLFLVAASRRWGPAGDDGQKAQTRYAPLLVSVRGAVPEAKGSVIDVASIDDLARLAERHGGMILQTVRGSAHTYFVQAGGITYRHEAGVRAVDREGMVA